MPNPDGYSTPVDFRVTQNPTPVKSNKDSDYNFQEIYDFIKQVILTFVQFCGVGQYDPSLWSQLPPQDTLFSGNLNKLYIPAKQPLLAGHLISLVVNGGVLNADYAAAGIGAVQQADGFVTTSVINAGDMAECIMSDGLNLNVPGPLTLGQRYWLDVAIGRIRTTPLTAAGQLEQSIGIAVTTTSLLMHIGPAIQH
jgi:hypothetical protein